MQTASLGSVVKRSVPAASKGQVVCMGEFFLLQILTLNLLLSNIAVDSTIGDFCICIIFVPLVFLSVKSQKGPVPSGYPNPTRYSVFLSIPDLTRFSFRNHWVAGNPKHQVLPDISGKPEVSGTTRYFGYHL